MKLSECKFLLLGAAAGLLVGGPTPAVAAAPAVIPDSAAARLDLLGKEWWNDQLAGHPPDGGLLAVPDHPLTLLDAERADPTTWLALTLILGLPPADRWRLANGQTFVQSHPDSIEQALLNALGVRAGLRHPRTYEVRTEASTVVWVGLSTPSGTVDVPVAWPAEWRTVEGGRAMRDVGWMTAPLPAAGLVDPSFEDALATRVAWWSDGVAVPDAARTALGAHSMRLEGDADLYQRIPIEPGVALTVRVKLAAEGSRITPRLSWEDDDGKSLGVEPGLTVTAQAWQDVSIAGTAPAGASAATLIFESRGDGFANADDVRLTRSDLAPGGGPRRLVRAWVGTAVRLYADPALVPDADTHLAHIDQAVRGALGLLGQPTAGVVDVHFSPAGAGPGAGAGGAVGTGDGAACSASTDPEVPLHLNLSS